MCTLRAPLGTPLTKYSSGKTYKFSASKPSTCQGTDNSCPWINSGTILNFHGYEFQRVRHGCVTNGSPSADVISSVPFESVKKNSTQKS